MNFLEDSVFIGNQVEDTIGYDDIGGVCGDGYLFYIALTKFNVVEIEFFCVGPRLVDHGGGKVNADDLAGLAGLVASDEGVIAGAGTEVDHDDRLLLICAN